MMSKEPNELYEKLKEDIKKAAKFHRGYPPGVAIGAYMVDYALELLGDYKKLKCVVETSRCLPDAVQVMTPCTLGNPYFKWIDYGKFALTLYDRETGSGVRVYIDVKKMNREKYPMLAAWFFRDRSPMEKSDKAKATVEFLTKAGRDILSYQRVKVNLPPKDELYPTRICKICGESFISKDGSDKCKSCMGESYYEIMK